MERPPSPKKRSQTEHNLDREALLIVSYVIFCVDREPARRKVKHTHIIRHMSLPRVPPRAVGIHALEVFVPSLYVNADDLEAAMGRTPGAFTAGLGQSRAALMSPDEDAVTMAIAAVQRLMRREAQHVMVV